MLTCFDVADYFLSKTDEEAGDVISNLKLQKLVYYAQGFTLAVTGKPLFNEPIEAWQHGPVVPDLYHRYKDHGAYGIPAPTNVDFSKFSSEIKEILDEVYDVYGQFSAGPDCQHQCVIVRRYPVGPRADLLSGQQKKYPE